MGGTFRILVALVLAYAWTWTSLFKDWQWVTERQRMWILVAVGVLFLLQQIAQNLPTPADRSSVEARRFVIESYLQALVTAYYEYLQTHSAQVFPPIRVNLMLRKRKFRFWWVLRMYYTHSPEGGTPYSAEEMSLEFGKGQGACGRAWKSEDIQIFDAKDDHLDGALIGMSQAHKDVTRSTVSVLSVPITRKGRVVGVLSMDSAYPTPETRFHLADIVRLAKSHADALSDFCFSDGVG